MANVYDKVKKIYGRSVHTPDYMGNPDILINPAIPDGVPEKYWKVEFDNILEMSQAEKDAVDLELDNARKAAILQYAENEFNANPVMLAFGKMLFNEINKLRVKNGDPAYTRAQFNTALQTELESSIS